MVGFVGFQGCVSFWFFFPEALHSRDRRLQIVRVFASPFLFWRLVKPSLHSADRVQFLSVGIDDLGS
jgi:hypothetical protein